MGQGARLPDAWTTRIRRVGWSYMEVPGSTPFTRGSEAENVETSAWGRAIGALGIGIAPSIATTDEIDNKEGEADRKPPIKVLTAPDKDPGGITGTAEIGTAKDSDFQLRETPDGWALGFRLVSDKGGIKVIAFDAMAQALAASVGETVGKRVTVWGRIKDEEFTPKGAKRPVTLPGAHPRAHQDARVRAARHRGTGTGTVGRSHDPVHRLPDLRPVRGDPAGRRIQPHGRRNTALGSPGAARVLPVQRRHLRAFMSAFGL